MRDTIIWRGMVVFLSSSAIACVPAERVQDDTAAVPPAAAQPEGAATDAAPPAAAGHADTGAVAAPPATEGGTSTGGNPMKSAPGTVNSVRTADTVKERRGYDRAITPDFKDPRKRLPPAPDSSTDSTST